MNFSKFFEYVYLCIFIISTIEVIRLWNHTGENRFWIFVFFGLASLGMFFFRRTYRKKVEKRKSQNRYN